MSAKAVSIISSLLLILVCIRTAAAESPQDLAREGYRLYQQSKFSAATPILKQASQLAPTDMNTLYYLGVSAFRSHDNATAVMAFSKIIVANHPTAPFSISAQKYLSGLRSSLHPYSCLRNAHYLCRWAPLVRPIKIYISDGLQLPAQYSGRILDKEEYGNVLQLLQTSSFLRGLSKHPLFTNEDRSDVTAGLSQWAWAGRENLFTLNQTLSPLDANILVFFCGNKIKSTDSLPDKTGICLYGYSSAQPCIIEIVMGDKSLHEEVWSAELRNVSAHEIGHALGLEHSPNPLDLMYGSVTDTKDAAPTENDKQTIRALYSMPTNFMMSPQ